MQEATKGFSSNALHSMIMFLKDHLFYTMEDKRVGREYGKHGNCRSLGERL